MEFIIKERSLFKVSPVKGVMRFEKKRKLSPRYTSPFSYSVGVVAYELALPLDLLGIRLIF